MSYPQHIQNLIPLVESTRGERIGQAFDQLDLAQRKTLLTECHPDYIDSQKKSLRIGPNTGDRIAKEVVDLLESYSLVDPDRLNLNSIDFDVDVLVVGAGGAGLSAAIEAHKAGAKVLLATKLRLGDSNTVMAQGGIQAADKADDTPVIHYKDVMGGGHFTNDPNLVRTLTEKGPATVHWLESLGVMFDKADDGEMVTIHGGGTSRKRMHSAKDYSGLEIIRCVRDEFINLKIPYLEFCAASELIKDTNGQIAGAVLRNMETGQLHLCRAKTVVLATGGMGRLHIQGFPCSNHYGATADGIVLGYRAGVPFCFLQAIQYHPTGAIYPEPILGLLVTEKVRGLGAQLLNKHGQRFVYELQPRDIVAAAIIQEVKVRHNGVNISEGRDGVWLDSPIIDQIHGKGTVQNELPAMYRQYAKLGIRIDEEPILIYPTQHYQNGGLTITPNAQTHYANLFAAGEVAGGIHGENRLMGNSLLDIFVFGRTAGQQAAATAKTISLGPLTLDHVRQHNQLIAKLAIEQGRQAPILLPSYK